MQQSGISMHSSCIHSGTLGLKARRPQAQLHHIYNLHFDMIVLVRSDQLKNCLYTNNKKQKTAAGVTYQYNLLLIQVLGGLDAAY